jgi:acetate---CoA ligase (ADP-forming) subunit beta
MKQIKFEDTLRLIKKYNLNFIDSKNIKSECDLNQLKFPIVMKVASEEIVHKSDVGGVIVGIKNEEEAKLIYTKLKKISNKIIVQKMAKGKEVIIGMKRDAQFGPVIMFGLGGIFVELMKDVSFRICPVDKKNALDMIKEIKSSKILKGIRGDKPVNINKLAEIIVGISELSMKEDIEEIDLNPVMVNEETAIIVDARFMK